MNKIFAIVLIVVLTTHSASAATIYLIDKTRIEKVEIIREVPEEFHIRKAGETYSIMYSYDVVKKSDIFCVIDDKGMIGYPISLTRISKLPAEERKELSPQDFQEMMFQQQLDIQKDQNTNLKGVGTALMLLALASVSSSIALWCLYGQTN